MITWQDNSYDHFLAKQLEDFLLFDLWSTDWLKVKMDWYIQGFLHMPDSEIIVTRGPHFNTYNGFETENNGLHATIRSDPFDIKFTSFICEEPQGAFRHGIRQPYLTEEEEKLAHATKRLRIDTSSLIQGLQNQLQTIKTTKTKVVITTP